MSVTGKFQIPGAKSQISSKNQIAHFKHLAFGALNLEFIRVLDILI
jgi:hypothetical protein